MHPLIAFLASLGLTVTMSACGNRPPATAPLRRGGIIASEQPQPDPIQAQVPWVDYAPGLQPKLEALYVERNCPALDAEADAASRDSSTTLSRTGHDNAQLTAYLSELRRRAECH